MSAKSFTKDILNNSRRLYWYSGVCPQCGSELIVSPEDIMFTKYPAEESYSVPSPSGVCKFCGSKVLGLERSFEKTKN